MTFSPRKSLSQNFLIDKNIANKIVDRANVQEDDVVCEIGPGKGILTQALLERGARVIAVEIDERLTPTLNALKARFPRLEIIWGDFLDLSEDLGTKVVANLPYHITTPILAKLLLQHRKLSTLTLMVQREYAHRLRAKPNTPEYGSLTLFAQCYSSIERPFFVSRHCFSPKPSVDSAVVHLALKPPPLEEAQMDSFHAFVRRGFSQRRKMLSNALSDPNAAAALSRLGLNPKARAEALSLEQFLSFYAALRPEKKKASPCA